MSIATRRELNVAALSAAIHAVSRHRKISLRDVAAETGVSASTLTRLSQGQKPDADALVTLLAWLHADVSQFTRDRMTPSEQAHNTARESRPERHQPMSPSERMAAEARFGTVEDSRKAAQRLWAALAALDTDHDEMCGCDGVTCECAAAEDDADAARARKQATP